MRLSILVPWCLILLFFLKLWHFRFSQACKELLRKSLTWSLFALRPNKFSPTGKSHNNWQEFSICWSQNWNTKNDNASMRISRIIFGFFSPLLRSLVSGLEHIDLITLFLPNFTKVTWQNTSSRKYVEGLLTTTKK